MRFNRVDLMLAGIVTGPITAIHIAGRMPMLWVVDVVIAILTVSLLLQAGLGKLRFTGAEVWLGLYLLICLMTIITSVDVLGFLSLFKLRVMPLLVLLIAYNAIETQEDMQHIQVALALCGAGIAILMLFNTYVYSWGYAQLDIGAGTKAFARSNIGRNNYLASIYAILTPFCFSLFVIRKPIMGLVTSLIVITAIIATQSRGGVICLVIGLFLWAFMMATAAKKLKTLLYLTLTIAAIVGGLYIMQTLFPEAILKRFSERFEQLWVQMRDDPESISRVSLAKDGIAAFLGSPWIGVGLGTQIQFSAASGRVAVHNLYIELLMQTGIFSFLAYMMFLGVCGWNLFRLRKAYKPGPQRILAGSMLVSFIIALLNAAVEPSYWAPQFSCLFAIILAMGFAQRRIIRCNAWAAKTQYVLVRPPAARPC